MNRYDTPALAEFIDTYVPVPFELLLGIGREMNARRDAAEKMLQDQIREWGKFQTESDVDRANYDAETRGRIRPLLDLFAANPEMIKTAEGLAAIANIINTTDYGKLAQLELGAKAYAQRKANIAEMTSKGLYNPMWDTVNMKAHDTLNKGIVELAPLQYRSVVDIVKPFLDNLGEKSYRTGNGYIWKGKNREMVEHQVQQNMSSILNSPFSKAHIQSKMRQNPGMTEDEAVRQYMNEVITASHEFETSALSADPIYVQQMINDRYLNKPSNKTTGGGKDEEEEYPLQDWMSRRGKVSSDRHVSNFNEFASPEYKEYRAERNMGQLSILEKAKELMGIINDSVSSEATKSYAKDQLAELLHQYDQNEEVAEQEDKHAIVQGALTQYILKYKDSSFFDPSAALWTGSYLDDGNTQRNNRNRPSGVAIYPPGFGAPIGGNAFENMNRPKETRAREYGNVFDLNSDKYNGGWFKDDNKYSNSDVDELFDYTAEVVMVPAAKGNIKEVEDYFFRDRVEYGGDQTGFNLPSSFRLKTPAKFLGEYDPLLKKQAQEAGIDLDKLQREDFPIVQWINGEMKDNGRASNIKVNSIRSLNFSVDYYGRKQVDMLMDVDVPLSEIEKLSDEWWGEEDELRALHYQIIGGEKEGSEKYVRVPVVATRPYDVEFSSYVNPSYQHRVHMPSTAVKESEAFRSMLEYMQYGISPADQYISK